MSAVLLESTNLHRNAARREQVRQLVERRGFATVGEIAARCNVSAGTARKDIRILSDAGLVHGYRGGVGRASAGEPRSDYASIARLAAAFASPGATIGVSAGRGAVDLARELIRLAGVTIVTNSLMVSSELHATSARRGPSAELITLPGYVDERGTLGGPLCVDALGKLYLDVVFLSVAGFDHRATSFSARIDEAEAIRAFRRSGSRTVFVSPSTEWAARSQVQVGRLTDDDVVVTDGAPSAEDRLSIDVVLASLVAPAP